MKKAIAWAALLVGIPVVLAGASSVDGPPAPVLGQEKTYPLTEVSEAGFVKAWSGRLYVSDGRSREVLVYSLDGARFLGRIGKPGQGPGEFDAAPRLVAAAGRLAAKSFSKLLFFSPEGVFEGEAKGFGMELMVSGMPVFPIEGGYIGFPFIREADGRLSDCIGRIYDASWKPLRDFGERFSSPTPPPPPPAGAEKPTGKQDLEIIRQAADAAFAGGKVYFAVSRKGFELAIFDVRGEKIGEIRVPIPAREVTREEKQRILEEWREARKKVADLYNPILSDTYPAFAAFRLDGDRIYVVTPWRKDGRYEILTLSLEGKLMKREFAFPLEPSWRYPPGTNGRFDILDGRLYTVDYNETAERYELRMTPLK